MTNNANQQDPSHLGTGIFESARISITEAETTTNTSSLNIKRRNFRSTNCKAAEEKFEEAVNEIKSQMQKILTAITSSITIPETARYEAKFILSVASNTSLNTTPSMIKTFSEMGFAVLHASTIESTTFQELKMTIFHQDPTSGTHQYSKFSITEEENRMHRPTYSPNIKGRINGLSTKPEEDLEEAVKEMKLQKIKMFRSIISSLVSGQGNGVLWKTNEQISIRMYQYPISNNRLVFKPSMVNTFSKLGFAVSEEILIHETTNKSSITQYVIFASSLIAVIAVACLCLCIICFKNRLVTIHPFSKTPKATIAGVPKEGKKTGSTILFIEKEVKAGSITVSKPN